MTTTPDAALGQVVDKSELPLAATPADNPRDTAEAMPEVDEIPESANKEAATYRRRLRDAEAERDVLAQRLADAQRQNVTSQLAQRFADPSDFWAITQLADVLGEDGGINDEKLSAAMNAALEAKPHWKKPAPATESVSSVRSNDRVEAGPPQPSFADAFRPPGLRN